MRMLVNGVHLHCEVYGPSDGLPLLFIHGFPLTSEMWSGVIQPLRDEFRLIIPDLRGFGRSDLGPQIQPGTTPTSSIAQYADDLAKLLELIGEVRPVVVIGLSMGGYIAFELYRSYASQVLALVLVDTRAEADTPERRQERYAAAQHALLHGSDEVADSMAKRLFAVDAPEALRERWRQIMRQTEPETVAAVQYAMASRPDSFETAPHIYCPTLIVVGEQDIITPPADARRIHEAIPASQLQIVSGAGHMVPTEQPQRFADLVRQFLANRFPMRGHRSED